MKQRKQGTLGSLGTMRSLETHAINEERSDTHQSEGQGHNPNLIQIPYEASSATSGDSNSTDYGVRHGQQVIQQRAVAAT